MKVNCKSERTQAPIANDLIGDNLKRKSFLRTVIVNLSDDQPLLDDTRIIEHQQSVLSLKQSLNLDLLKDVNAISRESTPQISKIQPPKPHQQENYRFIRPFHSYSTLATCKPSLTGNLFQQPNTSNPALITIVSSRLSKPPMQVNELKRVQKYKKNQNTHRSSLELQTRNLQHTRSQSLLYKPRSSLSNSFSQDFVTRQTLNLSNSKLNESVTSQERKHFQSCGGSESSFNYQFKFYRPSPSTQYNTSKSMTSFQYRTELAKQNSSPRKKAQRLLKLLKPIKVDISTRDERKVLSKYINPQQIKHKENAQSGNNIVSQKIVRSATLCK